MMEASRKWTVVIFGCVAISLIGFLDRLTAEKLSLYVFYAVPIFFGAWFGEPPAGIVLCVISVLAWMIVDLYLIPWEPLLALWNTALRLVFFIGISVVISSLRVNLELAKEAARLDFLTGLLNRRTFLAIADQERQRAIRHKYPLTLAYVDLDDFKEINDRSGHDVGDLVLKDIAADLKRNIRSSDLLARIGGDEFVVLLPETDFESAQIALNKLQDGWKKRMENQEWNVSVSIGAVTYTDRFPEIQQMVQNADRLMYAAKAAGKNRTFHQRDNLISP